jgi:hypothetical protein
VSPHTLRHGFATQLLRAGYDIRTVQELLGHKDVETTMICTHVKDRSFNRITRAAEDIGSAGAGGKTRRARSATVLGLAYGRGWAPVLAVLRPTRQQVAVGPRDGAGEKHRFEVPYQLTRWSNTYSGAGAGMSSQ